MPPLRAIGFDEVTSFFLLDTTLNNKTYPRRKGQSGCLLRLSIMTLGEMTGLLDLGFDVNTQDQVSRFGGLFTSHLLHTASYIRTCTLILRIHINVRGEARH